MNLPNYAPMIEVWRGPVIESIISGAAAVVTPDGKLVYGYGDVEAVTYLRSTAKPLQVLPFVEAGGVEAFGLTDRELALLCASHSGTDEHVAVVREIQRKIGVQESDLLCGAHMPYDSATAEEMIRRGEKPTSNRHNCSGKHTGMLASAVLNGFAKEEYLGFDHPVQKLILQTVSEMTDVPLDQIHLGVDGCSAPVFAIPLRSAALAMARLADPTGLPPRRAAACRKIVQAMTAHPFMVAGPNRFDTLVMELAGGKIFAKAGAEGYQGMGVLGVNPLGITFKIADGDQGGRARPMVATEILRQLGVLTTDQLAALAAFDLRSNTNWRKLVVGEFKSAFQLAAP